jgi:anti-sigma regulatory factor (Ser/Thr protein kinase)
MPAVRKTVTDDVALSMVSPGTEPLMQHRTSVTLDLTVSSRADLSQRRAEMRAWLGQWVGDRESDDVVLACGEAIDNGLEHGKPPVRVKLDWDDGGILNVVVRDAGAWSVSASVPPRGLGLPIMMALMDNVTVDTTEGTAVRLSRRL